MLNSVRASLQLSDNAAALLFALLALVLLLILGWLMLAWLLARQNRRIHALTQGVEGSNLEEVLTAHLEKVKQAEQRMDVLEQAVAILQAQMPECLQRAHLVRYDAFEDVGGEQSFSLALLNRRGDGILLTSVYSRLDVRVYAKALRDGRASHALSQEEERVLSEMR